MQRKSLAGVDTPQPYSRKGLGGWMTNVSMRFWDFFLPFSLYREIGLTRLTSTPLTLTGSRAEACQPLRVIRTAWQGRDHGAPGGWQRPFGADGAISAPLDSDNAPGRPVNALHTQPACSGYGCRHQARQGRRRAFTGVFGGNVIGTAHVGGVLGMPTAPPPSAGTSGVGHLPDLYGKTTTKILFLLL